MTAHGAETLFSDWKLDRRSGELLHVQIERLLHDLISRPALQVPVENPVKTDLMLGAPPEEVIIAPYA
jgi:hypothetical protein